MTSLVDVLAEDAVWQGYCQDSSATGGTKRERERESGEAPGWGPQSLPWVDGDIGKKQSLRRKFLGIDGVYLSDIRLRCQRPEPL
jgi:hypothetical protein